MSKTAAPKDAGSATTRRKREALNLSPADAVGVLAAAVGVCLKAGLTVRATNADGALVLVVNGAAVDHATTPPRLTLAAEVTK